MTVEAGQVVSGKVTGITNFGAFVNLPENQSGLVHISEISEGYVKDIADYLSVGDEVDVKVLKITPDGKINLSIRQAKSGESAGEAKPVKHTSQVEQVNRVEQRRPVRNHAPREYRRNANTDDFDSMMSQFLKDSEDRLSSLRRNTESKRGGRGGRRN